MFKRAGTLLFAIMAVVMSTTALIDVVMHGRLTVIDPNLLGALAVIGLGFLVAGLLITRNHASDLEVRADRLTALTEELETFVRALETTNQKLHASEARSKGLMDSQGDAVFRRTPDGRLTYANEGFLRLFGIKPAEAIGQPFRPELHPDSPPPTFGRPPSREAGRERIFYDQHVKTIAGYRWIAWEDYAIRDAEGRLIEIQSVGRDITERKRMEGALTEARDKAQEASRAKSHFLATMSHEIRTPMNGVLGMARLLLETPLLPDQKTYAEAIAQSGMALLSLIEELLDFSKIESGSMALDRESVDLRALIESVTELLAPRAQGKDIELTAAVAADVPEKIETDAVRLRQILTNLVGNAVKITEDGGVLVSASLEKGIEGEAQLRVSVRDTGIGVPEARRAEIFEDFVQADSSHARRFGGTGLGLAISKRLIKAMGGAIGVTSANERGSIFWITLPLANLAPSDAPQASAAGAMLQKKRIALVSPSALLRSGLKMQVAACNADFVEASSLDALSRLSVGYDAAVFDSGAGKDASLPDVSTLSVPTIVLLPPHQRAELSQLSAKGFQGYLMKPVRQASLEQRLAAVLLGENMSNSPLESSEASAGEPDASAPPALSETVTSTPNETVPTPVSTQRSASLDAASLASRIEPMSAAPSLPKIVRDGLKILLAEDNPVNALLARELLRRRGHTVKEVSTGERAIAALSNEQFDLVIMDVHMPGLDGLEATRRIREAEAGAQKPRTPILALTADALDAGRRACLDAGLDGVLTKPLDPVQLDTALPGLTPPAVAAA